MRLDTDRTCTACNKPMAWVLTQASRQVMPLDPEPVPDGNIVIRDGLAVVVGKDLMGPTANEGEPRYKSHYATCTNPGLFRRRKGRSSG